MRLSTDIQSVRSLLSWFLGRAYVGSCSNGICSVGRCMLLESFDDVRCRVPMWRVSHSSIPPEDSHVVDGFFWMMLCKIAKKIPDEHEIRIEYV
jgi:hypothetical protein